MLFYKNTHVHFSYRIEHAMEINVLKNINLNSVSLIFKKIIHAINIHRDAMKLVQIFKNLYRNSYFIRKLYISIIKIIINKIVI
jgi:hypothetical protein